MKLSALQEDELARLSILLRDEIGKLNKQIEELKLKREKIEGVFLQRFQAAGIESMRTKYGTAYKTLVGYASVGDKDAFLTHVRENDAFELIEARASKEGVAQYKAEHQDLPPGVNWREEVHINIRRS